MHLSDGEIRSHLDQELSGPDKEKAEGHLRNCTPCQEKVRELANLAQISSSRLDSLAAEPDQPRLPGQIAFAKFSKRYLTKEKDTMFHKVFTRAYRPAWIIAGILLIMAVVFSFPSARAIANSFLGLFRVEKLTVIQVDSGILPEQLGTSDTLQALFSENTHVEQIGEYRRDVTPEEASQLAGIPIRLPVGLKGEPHLEVQPGSKLTLRVDLALVNDLLRELGHEDIQLPPQLDGSEITVEIPPTVVASIGACGYIDTKATDPDRIAYTPYGCANLIQVASPTINAPAGMDLAQIGSALLQVAGMPPEDAEALSRQIDWATTLVLPIPRYEATVEQVTVDGVEGTFIRQAHTLEIPHYMLVWIKNGIIYALAGAGDKNKALSIADTLQ